MRFQVLTIFPELFDGFTKHGLVNRAIARELVKLDFIQLRDFAVNTHGQVDDTPYGGGSGMVLRVEPAVAAIEKAKSIDPKARVISFSPRGRPFKQKEAHELLKRQSEAEGGFILLCSRYEGIDERVVDSWVDEEISLGDFIVMGAEIPAMAFIESISRLIPGVLGNPDSTHSESFENGLLEYPHYTKPSEFRGQKVPEVLLSGNHSLIEKWRETRALEDTVQRRPELIPAIKPKNELALALLHYPVLNKQGDVVTSSITNLDIHDISRSARTYGISRYYIVHPVDTMRKLAERIQQHWATGFGSTYNHNRKEALDTSIIAPDLETVLNDIRERTGKAPKLITTSARGGENVMSYASLRAILATDDCPHLILLGTGWGMAPEIMNRADYQLAPIEGPTAYNHLAVRAAAAIILDRILGK